MISNACFADVIFGLYNLYGLLLDLYGNLSDADSIQSNKLGILGDNINAVDELVKCSDNVLINGDPGGGKSFAAKEITTRLIKSGKRVVYFPCSRIQDNEDLVTAIENYLTDISQCSHDAAQEFISNADAIVLDGIDEALTLRTGLINDINMLTNFDQLEIIFDPTRYNEFEVLDDEILEKLEIKRSRGKCSLKPLRRLFWDEAVLVAALLTDVKKEHESIVMQLTEMPKIVATCRSEVKIELNDTFRKIKLLPFSDKELHEFIEKHCQADGKDSASLHKFLLENSYIKDVCRSPLTASILIGIYLRGGNLPSSRSELYDVRMRLLLREWDRVRGVNRPVEGRDVAKENVLLMIAYYMHKKGVTEIKKEFITEKIKTRFTVTMLGTTAEKIIDDLIVHHGLLVEREPNVLTFGHLSHQEFFCAKYMVIQQRMSLLVEEYGNPWWRNVTKFFVGIMGNADTLLEQVQEQGKLVDHKDSFISELIQEGMYAGYFSKFIEEFRRSS